MPDQTEPEILFPNQVHSAPTHAAPSHHSGQQQHRRVTPTRQRTTSTNAQSHTHIPSLPQQALRKRIENELSRKRTISTTYNNSLPPPAGGRRRGKPSAAKGTVAALKPSPALTVPETITVAEASQLCAAKRTDCVLVVDEEEGLSGIFTAKDLAYRVSVVQVSGSGRC